MTDREKLIELINQTRTRVFFKDKDLGTMLPLDAEIIADHLIANGVTVQKWIPASEPPKTEGEYIVMIHGATKSTTLWYVPYTKTWTDNEEANIYHVTHWMPLPEPPKGE